MTQSGMEVEGAEQLDRTLSAVAEDIGDMGAAAGKAAQTVRTRASSLAPVDTGNLARSIRADAGPTEVTVGTDIPYGPYQEYGTITVPASPYLRPALEASTNAIVDAYTAEVQSKLATVKGA